MKSPLPYTILHYAMESGRIPFREWMAQQSEQNQASVFARIDRLAMGLLGDSKAIGDGVFELRFKNGTRVYFGFDAGRVVIILCGGAKGGQQSDIRFAKKYWKNYEERK